MSRSLEEVDVTPAKKAVARKAAGRKPSTTVKKPSADTKRTAPKTKAAAPVARAGKQPVGKKTTRKRSTSAKVAPKKAAAATKKTAAKKTAVRQPAAKKTTPKQFPPPKAAAKKAATKAAPKKPAPTRSGSATKKVAAAPPAPKRPTVGPYAKEPKFLDEQRTLLLEERGIYAGQAEDLRAEADSLALEREPGDVQFDEESGEGGTVTVDRERNLALSAQAVLAVEEIDDALRKIERKTYGACERCFQPIPKARLRALPFARLCVACKSGGLSRR